MLHTPLKTHKYVDDIIFSFNKLIRTITITVNSYLDARVYTNSNEHVVTLLKLILELTNACDTSCVTNCIRETQKTLKLTALSKSDSQITERLNDIEKQTYDTFITNVVQNVYKIRLQCTAIYTYIDNNNKLFDVVMY